MNTMELLYKEAFRSCFWGVAMAGSFVILPVEIGIMASNNPHEILQLAVFAVFGSFCFTSLAFVLACLIPLYANVMDGRERVKRLVQICRVGRWVMSHANWPVFLWRKVLKPTGLYIGGVIAVAGLALGLWLSSMTKASREEDKADSWIDAWLG